MNRFDNVKVYGDKSFKNLYCMSCVGTIKYAECPSILDIMCCITTTHMDGRNIIEYCPSHNRYARHFDNTQHIIISTVDCCNLKELCPAPDTCDGCYIPFEYRQRML